VSWGSGYRVMGSNLRGHRDDPLIFLEHDFREITDRLSKDILLLDEQLIMSCETVLLICPNTAFGIVNIYFRTLFFHLYE